MLDEEKEDTTLDLNIDDLFKDPEETVTETDNQVDNSEESSDDTNVMTEAVTKRINTVRRKTEIETQDRIAKELGYNSYAELQKAKEKDLLKNAGLDEEEVASVVEKIVEKRIAEDPRFKRLEEIEAQEKNNFVNSQLKEINKLAGTKYSSIEELPQDTLSLWEKTGNLKQAYLATQGEALLNRDLSYKQSGSLAHLASPGNSPTGSKVRALTEEEKAIYRSVMPDITDEELSKKTVNIK